MSYSCKATLKMKEAILIIIASFFVISCEVEETVIKNAPTDNLVSNVTLTDKLLRMVQSPTAIDDIIDGSSCFAISFPFTAVANGIQVNLQDESDYQQVRNIQNESNSDVDTVVLQYPVTVVYTDYSEATITSQQEFDEIVANCNGSIELSCMTLSYPVGIKSYNSKNQLAESFNLGDKKAVYELLRNLDKYDALVLNYPIIFNAPDGTALAIENNELLETEIDDYTDECQAALNPEPDPVFADVIVQGTWYISYFFLVTDQTADYADYDFTFTSDGSCTVTGGSELILGFWAVSPDIAQPEAAFTFSSPEFDNLSQIWAITSVSETLITMHIEANGIEPERYFSLSKN